MSNNPYVKTNCLCGMEHQVPLNGAVICPCGCTLEAVPSPVTDGGATVYIHPVRMDATHPEVKRLLDAMRAQ
jgi:hypothetical protein